MIRPDALPMEPVVVGPAYLPADVVFLSYRNDSTTADIDMTSTIIGNATALAYSYITVVIALAIVASAAFSQVIKAERIVDIDVLVTHTASTFWAIAQLIVMQVNYKPSLWSVRLLWFSLILTVFVVVVGYLLNLMAVEQTVAVEQPKIDSLRDFLEDEQWRDRFMLLSPDLPNYNYLTMSKNDTNPQLAQLMDRFRRDPRSIRFQYPTGVPQNIEGFEQFGNFCAPIIHLTDFTGIAERLLLDIGTGPLLCAHASRELTQRLYPSREVFAQGILTLFMSKKLHPEAIKVVAHRYTIRAEAGLPLITLKKRLHLLMVKVYMIDLYNWQAMECEEKMLIVKTPELKDEPPPPMNLRQMHSVFVVCGCMLTAAVLVLFIEKFMALMTKPKKVAPEHRVFNSRKAFTKTRLLFSAIHAFKTVDSNA